MLKNYLLEYKKPFIGFLIIYLIRLVIVLTMGIMPQDAYYYLYSEHLALSYFDHPPMVAYMLKLFSLLFGKSVVAIKLTDFIVTLLSFLAFYRLSLFFLSKSKALKASLFYGTTILVTILSINTTPDVPLIFFWTISLIFIYKALYENSVLNWAIAGLLIGLTFISKYTGIFLLFGLFSFLILSEKHRKKIFSIKSIVLLLFFSLGIFPVVYWNYSNDWASFAFQTSGRAESIEGFKIQPLLFLGNLATQMMLLIPFLFIGMMTILFKMGRKLIQTFKLPDEKNLFLMAFSLPLILFFFGVSLIYWVKLNWMMPGYVSAIILVSAYLGKKILNGQIITSLVLNIALAVQIVFYPINVKSDDTWFGWEEFSVEVEDLMKEHPESFVFANDDYKTSAILKFYLDRTIYAGNVIGKNGKQFYLLDPDLSYLEGSDAVFIDSEKNFKQNGKSGKVPEALGSYFERVTELDPILIGKKEGEPLRKFLVYKCEGYTSSPVSNELP